MRKTLLAAALGAAALASAPAMADVRDSSPEALAYLNFNFGGHQQAISNMAYGLRIDQDSRYREAATPSIFDLSFSSTGFSHAAVNGMPFAASVPVMNQDDGNTISYTVIDWGVLLLGVVGAGFIISEVADGEDDPEPTS